MLYAYNNATVGKNTYKNTITRTDDSQCTNQRMLKEKNCSRIKCYVIILIVVLLFQEALWFSKRGSIIIGTLNQYYKEILINKSKFISIGQAIQHAKEYCYGTFISEKNTGLEIRTILYCAIPLYYHACTEHLAQHTLNTLNS